MSFRIEIIEGDLTALSVDAIVNAANSALQHGGGVAGAIARRGGPSIQRESDEIGHVPVGSVAVTGAGSLSARWVIHAVGPRMGEGNEDDKLRSATRAALEKAEAIGARSIAFPAISTGIFGYPIDRCAAIMLRTAREYRQEASTLERVVFCLFGSEAHQCFLREYEEQAS